MGIGQTGLKSCKVGGYYIWSLASLEKRHLDNTKNVMKISLTFFRLYSTIEDVLKRSVVIVMNVVVT